MRDEGSPPQPVSAKTPANLWLAGAVCLGLVLRAIATFREGAIWVNTDTVAYVAMADAILRGEPVSYFPNGYPLMIAALTLLVGQPWLAVTAVSMNVVLSTLVIVFSGRIARLVGTARAGVLAAGLVAIWPNQINYTRQLLSETPATFLLVTGILLVLRRRVVWAGAALYAAAFVRSSLLPVVPAVAVWMIAARQGSKNVGLFALGAGLCLAADLTLQRTGVIGGPNNGGANLLISSRTNQARGIDFRLDGFTEAERAAPLATYLHSARERPMVFMRQRFGSLWELWGPWPEPGDPDHPRTRLTRAVIGLRFPAFILALLMVLTRPWWHHGWLLAIPIVSLTIVHTLFFSTPRFSYPAEPFILILIGVGAVARLNRECRE
ncbi:MAG: hypothetical protein Q8O42_03290 [Acidobacteriota bacterium]|nr:hypothetical protein [Acidobacteriota bacterium]